MIDNINSSHKLPFGTPEQVAAEMREQGVCRQVFFAGRCYTLLGK